MKNPLHQLLLFYVAALLLILCLNSCKTLHKSVYHKDDKTDSVRVIKYGSRIIDIGEKVDNVYKRDTSTTTADGIYEKTIVDETYVPNTVNGSDYLASDTAHWAPRLKKRRTTYIKAQGKIIFQNSSLDTSDITVKHNRSHSRLHTDSTAVQRNVKEASKVKEVKKKFGGWVWIPVALLLLIFLYVMFRTQISKWKILSK